MPRGRSSRRACLRSGTRMLQKTHYAPQMLRQTVALRMLHLTVPLGCCTSLCRMDAAPHCAAWMLHLTVPHGCCTPLCRMDAAPRRVLGCTHVPV
eukprot:365441-Chlamydomonas_euryale.AAC.14